MLPSVRSIFLFLVIPEYRLAFFAQPVQVSLGYSRTAVQPPFLAILMSSTLPLSTWVFFIL